MQTKIKKFFMILVIFLPVFFVQAQGIEDVEYPVEELGGCASKEECKAYCNELENIEKCINFGEKNGIISKKEAEEGRRFSEAGITEGPGGCKGNRECKNYCDNPNNIKECITFAQKHNIMPPEEIEEAKKILQALEKGAKMPGGCTQKETCEAYCEDPAHIEECVSFALAAGFMNEEEAEMVKKTGGKGPGGCRGKKECDAFCDNPNNMEVCMEFAIEYDIMPPEEIEDAKGALRAIKAGVKMPNCHRDECDEYCRKPENAEECINFSVAAGFMSRKEADDALKMMKSGLTTGPGGCKEKEECEAYCQIEENMQECMEFSVKAGFMSQEEYDMAMEHKDKKGPGGCQSEEECKEYCNKEENMQECMDFAAEEGHMSQEEYDRAKEGMDRERGDGPGGCASPEECEAYCSDIAHVEECFQAVQEREKREKMEEEMRKMEGHEEYKDTERERGEEFKRPPMPMYEEMEMQTGDGMPKMPTPEEMERMKQEAMKDMDMSKMPTPEEIEEIKEEAMKDMDMSQPPMPEEIESMKKEIMEDAGMPTMPTPEEIEEIKEEFIDGMDMSEMPTVPENFEEIDMSEMPTPEDIKKIEEEAVKEVMEDMNMPDDTMNEVEKIQEEMMEDMSSLSAPPDDFDNIQSNEDTSNLVNNEEQNTQTEQKE